jgi:hypothetical protein
MTTQNSYPALGFSSGYFYQVDGDTNPTPSQVRILQEASLDISATTKELFGQNKFAVATGVSQYKVQGKAKFADMQPRMIRDFVGAPNNSLMTSGQTNTAVNEAHSVPASSPYTITVTNSATFTLDLGVVYANTGTPLINVASGPTVGQYSYSAGVYTFAAADDGIAVTISYSYTIASVGDSVLISNSAAGAANTFQSIFGASYNGLQTNFQLYSCIPTKFNVAGFKIGEFNMPEIDYSATVNAANNLGIISVPVIS